MFICLEGIDGCGKTTQTRMLVDWLRDRGEDVVEVREPGGTQAGEEIRALLLGEIEMGVRCQTLLFMAARAELWEKIVRPALDRNAYVVADRWFYSTLIYQVRQGILRTQIADLVEFACEERFPDLTLVLDVFVEEARQRLILRGRDRFDDLMDEGLREGYRNLRRRHGEVKIIDGTGTRNEVFTRIKNAITNTRD